MKILEKMKDTQEAINKVELEVRKSGLHKTKVIEVIIALDQIRQYINGNVNKL